MLTLRGLLSTGSRREYAGVLAGAGMSPPAPEDAEQRGLELLFERLAARWVIAGHRSSASASCSTASAPPPPAERPWVRDAMREHCAEHFPELQAP